MEAMAVRKSSIHLAASGKCVQELAYGGGHAVIGCQAPLGTHEVLTTLERCISEEQVLAVGRFPAFAG